MEWLHIECVPSVFGGRAVLDVNISYVFPQGVLAAVTLVGGGLETEAITALVGWGRVPRLEQKP